MHIIVFVWFRCVPTSFQARQLILDAGLILTDLERESQVKSFKFHTKDKFDYLWYNQCIVYVTKPSFYNPVTKWFCYFIYIDDN